MRKILREFISSEFKSKVVLEAVKERYSLSEMAERLELHPNQISQWKQEFIEKSKYIFDFTDFIPFCVFFSVGKDILFCNLWLVCRLV